MSLPTLTTATPAQMDLMTAFASIIGDGIDLVIQHELGPEAGMIITKLKEAMFWHVHLAANKPEAAPQETNGTSTK